MAKRLLLKQLSKEKIRALMNFLKLYVRFGNEEFIGKFDQEVDTITNPSKTMGIEEFVLARAERIGELKGIKKVSLEKDHTFVKSLLEKTNFDTLQIADIASVTPEFVESVRKTIALS